MKNTRAFITNLGAYNSGYLEGKWVDFPIDEDDFNDVLHSIGVVQDLADEDEVALVPETYRKSGLVCEEWFVTDYEDYPDSFGEYESYESLEEYAEAYDGLSDSEIEIVDGLVDECGYSLEDAISKKDDVIFYPGDDDYDIAYNFLHDCGYEIPEWVEPYFDYAAYGRDIEIETSGFWVDGGYVEVD